MILNSQFCGLEKSTVYVICSHFVNLKCGLLLYNTL